MDINFNYTDSLVSLKIRDVISSVILPLNHKKYIIILCIGTDRCTGDSLGPLIGYKLKAFSNELIKVYGDLENPVHANNLEETINLINSTYSDPFIIAIDASLGGINSIGKIFIKDTPLTPGLAMNKKLPKVGNISITGIVNISCSFDFMILQNTRLHIVMRLADIISKGLIYSLSKYNSTNNRISF